VTGERTIIRTLLLVSVLLGAPAAAQDRADRETYFAYLRAFDALQLPRSGAAWQAFACARQAAKLISEREFPRLRTGFWREAVADAVRAEVLEALSQCKSEMDAIPQHSAAMQQLVGDMIARFREHRRQPIVCSGGNNLFHPCGTPLKR
jgi:hypothetical protein